MTLEPILPSARIVRGLVPYNLARPATSLPSQRWAGCIIAMSDEPREIGRRLALNFIYEQGQVYGPL